MHKFLFITLTVLFFLFVEKGAAQCPTAGFTLSGASCAGENVQFNNTSTGATNYSWDFCCGDFDSLAYTVFDSLPPNSPVSVSPVFDGTDWHVFIINDNSNITRLDYGNSLSNTPVTTTLASVNDTTNTISLLTGLIRSNIVFYNEGGKWYGLISEWGNSRIIRINFDSLTNNAPVGVVAISDPSLSGAFYETLEVDHDSIFVMVGNAGGGAYYSCLQFGHSILNTPSLTSVTVTIANDIQPTQIALVKICNEWKGLISMLGGGIVYVDYGSSLASTPQFTDMNIPTFVQGPVSIQLAYDGKTWMAVFQNYGSGNFVTKIGLGNTFTTISDPPVILIANGTSGFKRSLALVKDKSEFYMFSCSDDNMMAVSKFFANCTASSTVDTNATPGSISYSQGGTYYINLEAIDSSGNTNYFLDSVTVFYQPAVSFADSDFCLGDQTRFFDLTTVTNANIVNRHWSFGDGDSDSVANPTHLYAGVGTYAVTLTITSTDGCISSVIDSITIYPNPTAAFSAPSSCSLYPESFTDLSTISSGSIADWNWDFGTGGTSDTSSVQNPVYTYTNGGTFSVSLTVTSAAGCIGHTIIGDTIKSTPVAAFTPTNTCISQPVNFLNQTLSTLTDTTFNWNFGDGGNDTAKSPSHTYSTSVPGTYTVTLITQVANGCSDTTTQQVKINNVPTAHYSFLPATACNGNVITFMDASIVTGDTISGWTWDFGDGNTSTIQNPAYQYPTAGTYNVKLIAYSPSSCPSAPDSQLITVIQSPTALFSFASVCLGQVNFFGDHSLYPPGSSFQSRIWHYDDGGSDTAANPTHTFLTAGKHRVILTVTSNFGCTSSDTDSVTVHSLPVISFSTLSACTDDSTQFTNASYDSTSAIFYNWDFDDPASGSNNVSSLINPTHFYDSSAAGLHNVTLIAQNAFGCSDTLVNPLYINLSISPQFGYDAACWLSYTQFHNFSTPFNLDSVCLWNFGNGTYDQRCEPSYLYSFPGTYPVTLTVTAFGGCITSITKDIVVSDIPVAEPLSTPACIHNPYTFTESSNISSGSINRWDWQIPELGVAFDSVQNPVYTFDTLKNYTLFLTVTSDAGCTDTASTVITVYPLPTPNFSFSPPYGAPPLTVIDSNRTVNGSTYQWDFGDGSAGSTSLNPQHTYLDTGQFVIHLIATSAEGCSDSISKRIYVITPVLDVAVTHVSASLANNQLAINAIIANLGTIDIDSLIMQARLDDGTSIDEKDSRTLPTGTAQVYQFVAHFNVEPSTTISYYCVSAIHPNNVVLDNDSADDRKCSTLINKITLVDPYPNPFTNILNLDVVAPFGDQLTIELYNNLGQLIGTLYNGEVVIGLNSISANLFSLPDGIYTLRFSFLDQQIVKQVMKISVKK